MSDDGSTATGGPGATGQGESKLYSASGEPLSSAKRETQQQMDQLEEFVRAQPFTAAIVGLVLGYVLGKVT